MTITQTPPRGVDIKSILDGPYHIVLVRDSDEVGYSGYVAEVSELPGCWSQGATAAEAIDAVRDAMRGWTSVAVEDGREIPRPAQSPTASGRFIVRLPRTLHGELARRSTEEGVSLNQFVTAALAGAVGWRTCV